MWFRSVAHSLKVQPSPLRRPTRPLRIETLEDRRVLAADAVGDFLPSYSTGPQDPGMDVVEHDVALLEDRVVFSGQMAGPIAETQEFGGLYLFGVDRGQGTPRFLRGTPIIGPNVTWDLIVRVNPDGTGLVNNVIAGVITPLDAADINIDGDRFTASVPLSVMLPAATHPPEEWTYNLWPRNAVIPGHNEHVSDLAPDDGNAPFRVVLPGRVESVVVNDGSAQRSMVESLTVTFDSGVTLDPGAFELSRQDGSLIELNVAASLMDGRTVAVLRFAGPGVIGGSLADGNYTLTVKGDLVHDAYGRSLDGDGDGAAGGDASEAFFRLYGDSDGDSDVDWLDRDLFRSAFKTNASDVGYLWYFDFDGDGHVDGRDNGQFNPRFGQH